jgi:capsular polysaccharide biosynthesis protein
VQTSVHGADTGEFVNVSVTPTPAQITLGTYARLVVRHWKALVAGVVVGVLLAIGLFVTAPKTYTARIAVLVRPTVSDGTQLAGGRTSSVLNLDTEAQIVRSSLVASRAANLLGTGEDPLDLVRHVTITVPANTAVLDINFTASTPLSAQQGTRAFATAYLANRAATAQAVVDADVAEIQSAVSALDVELNDLAAQLTLLPSGEPDRVYLEGERTLKLQSKGRLQEQLDALVGGAVTGGEVLTDPRLPQNPSAPNQRVYLVGGMLAGLLLGLALALLAERRNRRVWRADEITDLHGLPVLAEIELVETSDGRLEGAASAATELSHLANTIRARSHEVGTVNAVVGASLGHATGWVSAGLALTLSRSGDRVTLVSAAPVPAAATGTLKVLPKAGLAELLTGSGDVDDVLVSVPDVATLTVIGVGADSSLGREWLNSTAMRELVAELEQRNAFVVLDSDAVPQSGDAQAMAALAAHTVIVADLGRTTPNELAAAARAISAVGTPLLGVVSVRRRKPRTWHRWLGRRRGATTVESVEPPVAPAQAQPGRGVRAARVALPSAGRSSGRRSRPVDQRSNGERVNAEANLATSRLDHATSPTGPPRQ